MADQQEWVWCCLKQFVHCQLLVLNCRLLNVCIIFVVFVPIVLNCLLVVLSAHKRHQALNAWLLARPFLAHCSSAHFLPSRIHFCLFDFFPLPHICLSLYKIPLFYPDLWYIMEVDPPPSSPPNHFWVINVIETNITFVKVRNTFDKTLC